MNPRSWNGFRSIGLALVMALALLIPSVAQALPADRVYEMVSPPDKEGGDVGAGVAVGNHRGSADGESLAYISMGGWGDAPQNGLAGLYVAHREPDIWSSNSGLLPIFPVPDLDLSHGFPSAVSPDFSRVVAISNMNQATGEEAAFPNLFLLDPVSKETERITPDPVDGVDRGLPRGGEVFGSADFGRVVFQTRSRFTTDSLGIGDGASYWVYLYEDGQLTLESSLPNGDPAPGNLPRASNTPGPISTKANNVVSPAGDAFYFHSGSEVYRRDLGGGTPKTDLVSADENSAQDPSGGVNVFAGGSADATIAYFTSSEPLVDEDTDNLYDVYRYEQDEPEGSRLTLVSVDAEASDSATDTGPVLDVDDQGGSVYFTSTSQLVAGETTDPGTKLYRFDGQELQFIAVTDELLPPDAMVSSDGEYFAFVSAADGLTAEDNGGFEQAYVYATNTGTISCASCLGDGEANTAEASWRHPGALLQLWLTAIPEPINNVSDNGHVFFETTEALLPTDTNNKSDVYVWQDGVLDLISTGRSTDDSQLMDASTDGSTVFFLTRSQLVGWDVDNNLDAYAARVGGGLPEPLPPSAPCSGDDCQGQPSDAPQAGDPASGTFSGPGNPRSEADCDSAQRKVSAAKRKAKARKQKAKQLERKARKASGKKAKRLKTKANKAGKRAKKAQTKRRQAQRLLRDCRSGS